MSADPAPIISKHIRCRCPNSFKVDVGSIIDDFCYFSTKVTIGRYSHIANGVSIGGGSDMEFQLGGFSSISSGVKIWCRSDDFNSDLSMMPPAGFIQQKNNIEGPVCIADCTIIGSNTVIMPNNNIPEGVAIGALSFVPSGYEFEKWTVYAGIPIRPIRKRNKEEVLKQKNTFLKWLEKEREHSKVD